MYIDIKSTFKKLPKEYKNCLYRRYIKHDSTVDASMVNQGIKLMGDILNGR